MFVYQLIEVGREKEAGVEVEFLIMWARNRVGIGLSYRPARPHRLAESIPWSQFLGSWRGEGVQGVNWYSVNNI